MTSMLTIATSRGELREAQRRRAEAQPGVVGLVLTMGALHAGHAALIRAAREQCDTVVVTIFVNPLQFGPAEDFSRYPRTLDADLQVCAAQRADIVFAPPVAEVYRGAGHISVDPGPLGAELEGASRPGHFAGVLTVVHKFLHIVEAAERVYFGEKDYQQLILIQAMARDLDLPAQILGCPTVREPDRLALSSRNRFLGPEERADAAALPEALFTGAATAATGTDAGAVLAAAQAVFDAQPGVAVDYLALRSPSLGPAPARGAARLLAAARVGPVRLIDNVALRLRGPA